MCGSAVRTIKKTLMPHPGVIPGPGGPKKWPKNSQNDMAPYWVKKSTWKQVNVPKHTSGNGRRYVGHFCTPSRCNSWSRWAQNGQKTAKMTGRHIEWKNQPGNWLMCHNICKGWNEPHFYLKTWKYQKQTMCIYIVWAHLKSWKYQNYTDRPHSDQAF